MSSGPNVVSKNRGRYWFWGPWWVLITLLWLPVLAEDKQVINFIYPAELNKPNPPPRCDTRFVDKRRDYSLCTRYQYVMGHSLMAISLYRVVRSNWY